MKQYIRRNMKPFLIGLSVGLTYVMTLDFVADLCVKIILALKQ